MKQLLALVCVVLPVFTQGQFVPDGPDAPNTTFNWNNGYTIGLSDVPGSNNEGQLYQELIPALNGMAPDPFWRFQGYLIFQTAPGFSISQNLFDPDVARLVAASDIDDGIGDLTGVRLYEQFDAQQNVVFDTCYIESITADDAGLSFSYSITVDAFTGLPLTASDEVCYLAVAYATNPDHVQEGCNMPDPILTSRKAAFGAIQVHCINGFTAAVNELEQASILQLHPLGADRLSITGVHDGEIVVHDQTGRTIMRQPVRAPNTILQVDALPVGTYICSHASGDGRRMHKRFVVAH